MQAKAAGSRTRAGGLLCLRDFTYCGLNGTAEVRVRGAEIRKILTHLAQDNDWAVEDLLGNPDIVAGRKLPCSLPVCRIVRHLPDGWSWWTGQSDYLVTKLRCSKVVAGRTFAHGLDDGEDFFVRATSSKRRAAALPPASPPRRSKRASPPSKWHDAFAASSPGSPIQCEGCVYPLPIMLHRAAYLAACPDRTAAAPALVRHICGNSKCAVVAHFRTGTQESNESDRTHHKHHPGTSREALPPLQ